VRDMEQTADLNDDSFSYHSWRDNVVLVFGTLSSFLA